MSVIQRGELLSFPCSWFVVVGNFLLSCNKTKQSNDICVMIYRTFFRYQKSNFNILFSLSFPKKQIRLLFSGYTRMVVILNFRQDKKCTKKKKRIAYHFTVHLLRYILPETSLGCHVLQLHLVLSYPSCSLTQSSLENYTIPYIC